MPDFETNVPEGADQPLERLALHRLRLVSEQHEKVDIRGRVELAAPVTAGRDQGGALRQPRHRLDRPVDELRVGFQQLARFRMREICRAQRGALGRDLLAQRRRAHAGAARSRAGGGGGAPAESVSTS